MKKKILKILVVIVILILGILYLIDSNKMKNNEPVLFSTWGKKYAPTLLEKPKDDEKNIDLVLSLEDRITNNSVWCGTFNLIWNDLKNDLAKQDIIFDPQPEIIDNLNKGTFTTNDLSEESYYKKYGTPTLELKKEIEEAIKEKFNEKSEILDDFNWKNAEPEDYFLYAMLKKDFEFLKEFNELEDGKFGNYTNVKYFGIDDRTESEVRNQVEVLYYNSKNDFAIKLLTKSNDEVIISRGEDEDTFGKIYKEIEEKSENYEENKRLEKNDTLKVPNISFNLKNEIKEVENNPFYFSDGRVYYIEKALQTVEFDLDKKGGRIKSEAGMMLKEESVELVEKPKKTREFLVDDTFTIFLKETGKELPYFAAKISNISNVQNDVNI